MLRCQRHWSRETGVQSGETGVQASEEKLASRCSVFTGPSFVIFELTLPCTVQSSSSDMINGDRKPHLEFVLHRLIPESDEDALVSLIKVGRKTHFCSNNILSLSDSLSIS